MKTSTRTLETSWPSGTERFTTSALPIKGFGYGIGVVTHATAARSTVTDASSLSPGRSTQVRSTTVTSSVPSVTELPTVPLKAIVKVPGSTVPMSQVTVVVPSPFKTDPVSDGPLVTPVKVNPSGRRAVNTVPFAVPLSTRTVTVNATAWPRTGSVGSAPMSTDKAGTCVKVPVGIAVKLGVKVGVSVKGAVGVKVPVNVRDQVEVGVQDSVNVRVLVGV